jgi:hypothetical protein
MIAASPNPKECPDGIPISFSSYTATGWPMSTRNIIYRFCLVNEQTVLGRQPAFPLAFVMRAYARFSDAADLLEMA